MNQFAVLHITKYKALGRIGNHIDRKHISSNLESHKTNFNQELTRTLGNTIDVSKSHLKEEFSLYGQQTLEQAVEKRIQKGYTQKRVI